MTDSTMPRTRFDGPRDAGAAIARHFDTALTALLHGDEVDRDASMLRVRTGEPHPLANFVILRDPDDIDVTRRAIEPLVAANQPCAVVLPIAHDPIDAVATFLAAEGFVLDRMPAMAIEIDRLAPEAADAPPVERIGDDAGVAAWVDALEAGYELPRRISELLAPDRIEGWRDADASTRFHGIRRDGRIVATSMVHLADGLAGVYCVSTVPDARRAGLGACVTAAALRDAARDGHRIGVLQSSAMGEPVYRRLGFEAFGAIPLFVRMPSG